MKTGLSKAQRGVALGMACACIAVIAIWTVAWFMPARTLSTDMRSGLLGVSLLGPALSLAAGVGFIARHRFFHASAIDGQNPADDVVLARARAYLTNTTEQALLATMVYPAMAFSLSEGWILALPLCSFAFVIGRVGFAMGIGRPARHRAFGFAVTSYSTLSGVFVAIAIVAASLWR